MGLEARLTRPPPLPSLRACDRASSTSHGARRPPLPLPPFAQEWRASSSSRWFTGRPRLPSRGHTGELNLVGARWPPPPLLPFYSTPETTSPGCY
ncbi:hypothetical protein E2562_037821 [Oryza meyeriana var. granulata]|uniref:Uncharacterized protein n=1 Tax=Oryza meyeriana var. granulata TaxID=110450 RepID=A0A6G1C366_9ORYZ|nr:hypothetical protein E2562_037821 [Oryza meyeriana var. granulata]